MTSILPTTSPSPSGRSPIGGPRISLTPCSLWHACAEYTRTGPLSCSKTCTQNAWRLSLPNLPVPLRDIQPIRKRTSDATSMPSDTLLQHRSRVLLRATCSGPAQRDRPSHAAGLEQTRRSRTPAASPASTRSRSFRCSSEVSRAPRSCISAVRQSLICTLRAQTTATRAVRARRGLRRRAVRVIITWQGRSAARC